MKRVFTCCVWVIVAVGSVQAQTAPSTYSAYTGTDTKPIPSAPVLGPANSLISDPTFGSNILRVTDQNTNGGESFISIDGGNFRAWNANSTAIKLTGPHGDGYWLEFDPDTIKVGDGSSHPALHPVSFGARWEWSTVDPDVIYFLNGNQIAAYNKSTGVTKNLGGPPNGDMVAYFAVVIGQDNWVCAAAGSGNQDAFTEIFCVNPLSTGTTAFIDVLNKTINGVPQSDLNWPTSASGQTIGIHAITGGAGASWLEVTFHGQSWGANGGAVFDLGTKTWSLVTNADGYWSGHVSMGNGKYVNASGSTGGQDSRGYVVRNPDNLMNSSDYLFVEQPPAPANQWCDAEHPSWLNSVGNPNAPVLISRFTTAPPCQFAWSGEIVAAAVDGSNTVWRFAHNHSTGSCYYGEGFAQISNDGKWALFSSYWDGQLGPDASFGCSTRIDTFIVQLTAAPGPTGLIAMPGNAQVSLSWTASTGATSYNVLHSTTSGSGYMTVATDVANPNYTDTGLANGTTYYYVVRAVDGSGTSPNSNEASATPCAIPVTPVGLAATAGNASVVLSWTASSGAASYNVKRSTTIGGPYATIAPALAATSYTDTSVTNGITYYYVVSAVDSCGESGNSAQVSATPTPGGRVNVARAANGGVASASSTYNSAYAAGGANDGDRKGVNWGAGGGWNDATTSVWPDWLEVDFSGSKTINEIDVFTVQDNYQSPSDPTPTMTFSAYGVTDFQVQYWSGSQWVTVPGGTVSGNNLVWRQFTFSQLTTSAIRVWVTGALSGFSRITEVEAYSAAANGVSVSLTSPTQGATYTAPATIPVTALATSSNGISKVDFFANGLQIGTATASPYSVSWSKVVAGSYTLLAVATDTQGAATTSTPVGISVNGGTGTNVARAANGGVASASSSYSSAYAAGGANDGDRKGVNWGAGGGWNDATASAWPDWLEVDFSGSKTINEIDVFTVQDNYQSPSDPTPTMTFSAYGVTDFQVQYWSGSQWVTVPGGAVSGNNLVWRQFTFSQLTTSAIRVWVTGALSGFSRITEVEAYSAAANGVSVSLTSPTQGATYTAPATIPVTALATSSNGISKVDFFANGLQIGTATASPYSVSWSKVVAGSYTLLAVATDTQGAATTSTPVGISVNGGTGTNVARAANGGVASASSTYNSAYAAGGANDGDRKGVNWGAGGGWNDATTSAWPDWLEVDFSGSKTINEIDVFTVQDNYQSPSDPTPTMTFSAYGVTDFQVQYWSGSQWVTVPGGAVSGNNLVWRQFTFSQLTTSAIRVWVTGALSGFSRITEVEAYTQ